jgi:hypothetical protein
MAAAAPRLGRGAGVRRAARRVVASSRRCAHLFAQLFELGLEGLSARLQLLLERERVRQLARAEVRRVLEDSPVCCNRHEPLGAHALEQRAALRLVGAQDADELSEDGLVDLGAHGADACVARLTVAHLALELRG